MNLRSEAGVLAELNAQIEADQSAPSEHAKSTEPRYRAATRAKTTPA
jgi:hypothetical protein